MTTVVRFDPDARRAWLRNINRRWRPHAIRMVRCQLCDAKLADNINAQRNHERGHLLEHLETLACDTRPRWVRALGLGPGQWSHRALPLGRVSPFLVAGVQPTERPTSASRPPKAPPVLWGRLARVNPPEGE